MILPAGERAVSPGEDSMDSPTQSGTDGSGKPQPVSVGCDALMFSALIRRLDRELPVVN